MTSEKEKLFDKIYISHFEDIKNFCSSKLHNDTATAEDIAQMSFSLLYAKWDSINSYTEAALLAWVYKTAKNIMKNYFKKLRHNQSISLEEYIEQGHEIIESASFVDDITYQAYKDAIEQNLSKNELQLLKYVMNEKFSMFEISIILDENINTVKSRWLRLRKKLREIIKKF